jgi:hypothetical protein
LLVRKHRQNYIIEQLAEYYKTEWVPEFARDYLQEKWIKASKYALLMIICSIAYGQTKLENDEHLIASLFCGYMI